jgi:hypothetical protein
MTITDRNLAVGTLLVGTYKGNRYECKVAVEDGRSVFVLEDGRRFKSPSSAGSAVMGGRAVNGWVFWRVINDAADAHAEPPSTGMAEEPMAPKAKKLIYRLPNQKGVEEGWSRFWCNACMKSFVAEGSEAPVVCPEGHRV